MDHTQLIEIFDREQRVEVTYPDAIREQRPEVVRHRPRNGNTGGFVQYSQLNPANADAVIAAQIAYFNGLGCDFEWKSYSYDQPPDLNQRLLAHGFSQADQEAVMVLDMETRPAALQQPVVADIRRVVDDAGLDDVMAVEDAVWQKDHRWLRERLHLDLLDAPNQLSIYVAYVDAEPAATAWSYFHIGTQFASLWGGSTVARFRRRGLYTALLAVRANEAVGLGYRFLTVDASAMSRPILEKLGFIHLADTCGFKWTVARPMETGS